MPFFVFVAFLFAPAPSFEKPQAAPKPCSAREVTVKGTLPTSKQPLGKPTIVTSPKELIEAVPDEAARREIARQVDLTNETLLLFAWTGAVDDRLTFTLHKDKPWLLFAYQPGSGAGKQTRCSLFAFPHAMSYKLPAR